jgi:hypothetical protein
MTTTPQQQAIIVANGYISIAQQVMTIFAQLTTLDQEWTDQGIATILAAMGTVALNADGTLGAADGSPNNAHPLNTATYPALSVPLSSNQIGSLKTILDEIETYVGGGAVATQIGARSILNNAALG